MLESRQRKEKLQEFLDELPGLGPSELADWNIKVETFFVFEAMADMNEQARQERMNGFGHD